MTDEFNFFIKITPTHNIIYICIYEVCIKWNVHIFPGQLPYSGGGGSSGGQRP